MGGADERQRGAAPGRMRGDDAPSGDMAPQDALPDDALPDREGDRRAHPGPEGAFRSSGAPSVARIAPREDGAVDGVPLLDLRGLNCPLPALKAGRRMRALAPGERLWIETTDPLATIDIPAMARENGHTLVSSEAVQGGHRFLLERNG